MDRATTNGGFPLPLGDLSVRELTAHHDACDGQTRLRVPTAVPLRAVLRVVCERCAQPYQPLRVAEAGPAADAAPSPRFTLPQLSLPKLSIPFELPTGAWRWVSLPIAALVVLGGLYLLQGGDEPAPRTAAPAVEASAAAPAAPAVKAPGDARLVSGSTFELALPPGWKRSEPSGGATFAAVAPDGAADVMLWIERDPKLNFASFEARSLAQLESLAGSAGVVARNPGPTPETTSVRIAPTKAPSGAPNYEVLLRASGEQWYYLATTSQPGASAETLEAIRIIQGSFLPKGGG